MVLRSYTYQSLGSTLFRSLTFAPNLLNMETTFSEGGYAVELPVNNKTAATAIVSQMKEDFIDDATRGIAVSFSFYNSPLDLFTVVQVVFEFSPSGCVPSFQPHVWPFLWLSFSCVSFDMRILTCTLFACACTGTWCGQAG